MKMQIKSAMLLTLVATVSVIHCESVAAGGETAVALNTTASGNFKINGVDYEEEEIDDDEYEEDAEDELEMIEEDMQQEASIMPDQSVTNAAVPTSTAVNTTAPSSILVNATAAPSSTLNNKFDFIPMTLAAESSVSKTRTAPQSTKSAHIRRKKHKPMSSDSSRNTVPGFVWTTVLAGLSVLLLKQ